MAFPSQIEHSTSESARLQDLGIDVLLVRHGESEHNLHVGVLDGHDDPGLTERGKRESVQTGAYLGKRAVDMVVTSQKRRAIETYERMGPFLADVPFAHDARLNEQDYGWASGMHKEDVYTGRTEQILQE